jgi:hypothetical protein
MARQCICSAPASAADHRRVIRGLYLYLTSDSTLYTFTSSPYLGAY